MNSIDFRRLAKEAGFTDHYSADMWGVMLAHDIEVERFTKLVAEAEREACAQIAEALWQQYTDTKNAHYRNSSGIFNPAAFGLDMKKVILSESIAYQIRTRSNHEQ